MMSAATSTASPAGGAGGKLASIEGARALAAIVVVLMHAANFMRVEHFSGHIGLGRIFDFGYVGVDFFFVLSGFIITYVHFSELGEPARLPRYLWRRFSRIFPIYWAVLLLYVGITWLGRVALGKDAAQEIASFGDILSTVFLYIGAGEPKYVGVAWSLQYEVMFYTAFAVMFFGRRLGAVVFAAWAGLVLGQTLGMPLDLPLNLGNAHCLQFLLGVGVGMLARKYRIAASNRLFAVVLLLVPMAVLFELYGPFGRHAAEGRIALGLASAALIFCLVGFENHGAIRTPGWLASMGSVSYSIYLGHPLFINLSYMILLKLGLYHALPEVAVFACAVGVALALTVLIGRTIELPLVSLMRNVWRRPRIAGVLP